MTHKRTNPFPKIFELGYLAFLTGQTIRKDGVSYQTLAEPMAYIRKNFHFLREWQRGYNAAYFDNIKAMLIDEGKEHSQVKASKSFPQYFTEATGTGSA